MSAFLQNTAGDWDFSANNLVIAQDEDMCAAQKLTNLYQLCYGEWFVDTRLGVPYIQYVLVKSPDLGVVASVLNQVVSFVPQIQGILSSSFDFNPSQRNLSVAYQLQTLSGALITGGPGQPFIIQTPGQQTS